MSHLPSYFLRSLTGWFLCGAILCLPLVTHAESPYRQYRRLNKEISKRYNEAVKKRYSLPCRAKDRLEQYQGWLQQFLEDLPKRVTKRRYFRYLRSRARSYQRLGKRRHRWCAKRCQRYWKHELNRSKSTLRSKCGNLVTTAGEGAPLWIGVRPWAHLYINGKLCGTAPLKAILRPGNYKIRLSFPPGQDEYNTTIDLQAQKEPTLIVRQMQTAPPPARRYANLLSPQQLHWVVKKYRSQFQSCRVYQANVPKIMLSWQVSPKGKPHSILWVSPPDPHPRFLQCILRAAKRMQFPAIKGSARIQAYPIELQ